MAEMAEGFWEITSQASISTLRQRPSLSLVMKALSGWELI